MFLGFGVIALSVHSSATSEPALALRQRFPRGEEIMCSSISMGYHGNSSISYVLRT